MPAPQPGQCDGGSTMDSSRGIRRMQTFRKLPISKPKQKCDSDNHELTCHKRARRLNNRAHRRAPCLTDDLPVLGGLALYAAPATARTRLN